MPSTAAGVKPPMFTNLVVTGIALLLAFAVARLRRRPTLYIIQGFLGAGKTTYSKKLAAETGFVRLNADEYCDANFPPEKLAQEWEACFAAAVTQLWRDAEKILATGRSVILDFGFWSRASRDHARAQAQKWNVKCAHHYVTAPDDVLLARIAQRRGPTAERNLKNFHDIRKHFTAPEAGEQATIIDTR